MLSRYLGRIVLYHTVLVMSVLLGLFSFVTFLDELGDLGRGGYDVAAIMAFAALSLPQLFYELAPMAALLGAIVGLSQLAGDAELTAMRAAGVSVGRITASTLGGAAVVIAAAMLVGELIAPAAEAQAQRVRAATVDQARAARAGLWLRTGNSYVRAHRLPDASLGDVRVFEFDPAGRLRMLQSAATADYQEGRWIMEDVRETRVDADGHMTVHHHATAPWPGDATPQLLNALAARQDRLSINQLRRLIRHLTDHQQHTAPFELAWWNRLLLPLSAAVMVALGIPFVFVNRRAGTLGRNLFIGIMLGLGYYAAHRSFGFLVLAGDLPPLLGAALPPLVCALFAAVGMSRVR